MLRSGIFLKFVIVFVIYLAKAAQCAAQQDYVVKPIVGLEMSTKGFHRDLEYSVQFDYPLAGKDCEYVLKQELPAAVYVSTDQLEDLLRLRKLDVVYPQFVDIEAPTEAAAPFSLLLRGMPKVTDTYKLPIHFRYHGPDNEGTFALVNITQPLMYISCHEPGTDLIAAELLAQPNGTFCLREDLCDLLPHTPRPGQSETRVPSLHEQCQWQQLKVDYQLKSPLQARIPRGNRKAFPPVLYATIIISWLLSLWTVFRTHAVPLRVNQKLEAQRLLQSKKQ